MKKRYIFKVIAESQDIAEKALKEAGFPNHYLLTTEPIKEGEECTLSTGETDSAERTTDM